MNKNYKILSVIAIVVLALAVIGATFAYFAAQGGDAVTRDVNILTHTVDTLSFSVSNNINIEVDQFNFVSGGNNLSSTATATAVLSPNSKTGSATEHYYIYLNISDNEFEYSEDNTNDVPELLLQVFDSNNQLVTLTGLGTQKTVGGLTGYDITEVSGILPILENHTINASNNDPTTETYQIVVTYINHNFNQNDNAGKEIEASLIVQKDDYRSEGLWVNYTKISDYSPTVIMDNLRYEMDTYCLNEPSLPTTIIPSANIPEWSFEPTSENSADVIVEFDNNIKIITSVSLLTDCETGETLIYTNNAGTNYPYTCDDLVPNSITGHLAYNNNELQNPTQMYNGIIVTTDLAIQFDNLLLQLDRYCVKKLIGEPQVTTNP